MEEFFGELVESFDTIADGNARHRIHATKWSVEQEDIRLGSIWVEGAIYNTRYGTLNKYRTNFALVPLAHLSPRNYNAVSKALFEGIQSRIDLWEALQSALAEHHTMRQAQKPKKERID